jgi:hypothetical protein
VSERDKVKNHQHERGEPLHYGNTVLDAITDLLAFG